MKFVIDGREKDHYQLTNREMVDLVKSDTITDEEREFLKNKIVERFEYDDCPRCGENNNHVFARQFSDFVNGKCHGKKETAELLARDHRYLQQEMFKVMLEYIKILAANAESGYYDPRNKWACETSKHMLEGLKAVDWWF